MLNQTIRVPIIVAFVLGLVATAAPAAILTFNSDAPANNAATRLDWLSATGAAVPEHLVTFESGFTNGQNISGVTGLFPAGLVITDTSAAGQAIIRSGAGTLGGSNPVGAFSLLHNESAFLELDFSANPVDYVAFQDIDQAGTSGVVTFVGGATAPISYETTGVSGNSAEFFGIFRNDMLPIARVQLDASGDGAWGLDTIEYGIIAGPGPVGAVPAPAALLLGAIGTGLAAWLRRRRTL